MSRTTYFNGLAAEDIAERTYIENGCTTLAKRWRSAAGEIDLIMRAPDTVIFVEVKARRTTSDAAYAISARQWQRIMTSAEIFMSDRGLAHGTDLRFDAALIDRHGTCEIIENAAQF